MGGGTPIDFGKNYKDGRRILGDGKTWNGLFVGAFFGITGGFGITVVAIYANNSKEFAFLGLNDFGHFPIMIPIICSICFGALLGDIIKSFLKRRIGKNRGEDWIPFDQLDFILGVLFFSFLMARKQKVKHLDIQQVKKHYLYYYYFGQIVFHVCNKYN
jgi:CDP-2,3-bis-(O-geranylgeranyl)-sn-glycerol synthase